MTFLVSSIPGKVEFCFRRDQRNKNRLLPSEMIKSIGSNKRKRKWKLEWERGRSERERERERERVWKWKRGERESSLCAFEFWIMEWSSSSMLKYLPWFAYLNVEIGTDGEPRISLSGSSKFIKEGVAEKRLSYLLTLSYCIPSRPLIVDHFQRDQKKIAKCCQKIDFTRKMIDFDTFTKIA